MADEVTLWQGKWVAPKKVENVENVKIVRLIVDPGVSSTCRITGQPSNRVEMQVFLNTKGEV